VVRKKDATFLEKRRNLTLQDSRPSWRQSIPALAFLRFRAPSTPRETEATQWRNDETPSSAISKQTAKKQTKQKTCKKKKKKKKKKMRKNENKRHQKPKTCFKSQPEPLLSFPIRWKIANCRATVAKQNLSHKTRFSLIITSLLNIHEILSPLYGFLAKSFQNNTKFGGSKTLSNSFRV
jgi:hypothetical protein